MKSDKIIGAVQGVTKKWAKQRKREERDSGARLNRQYVMMRRYHVTIRESAWNCMEKAYLKASSNGKLPAHARQIMYAARPYIQRTADREIGKDFDQYFTQTLLPDYMQENLDETIGWNVVFDARGHFYEPHTDEEDRAIPMLGTQRRVMLLPDVEVEIVNTVPGDLAEVIAHLTGA